MNALNVSSVVNRTYDAKPLRLYGNHETISLPSGSVVTPVRLWEIDWKRPPALDPVQVRVDRRMRRFKEGKPL